MNYKHSIQKLPFFPTKRAVPKRAVLLTDRVHSKHCKNANHHAYLLVYLIASNPIFTELQGKKAEHEQKNLFSAQKTVSIVALNLLVSTVSTTFLHFYEFIS